MNTKLIIIAVLIFCIIFGAWYGISQWQRSLILNGDRDVLLINKKEGRYSYLSASDKDEIESSYKIAGFIDEMTAEEIASKTKGLMLVGSNGNIPGFYQATVELLLPQEQDVIGWNVVLDMLTEQQNALCKQMPTADLSQYCTIRHGIYQAFQAGLSSDFCEDIFIQTAREECKNNIDEDDKISVRDADQNGLIDSFELYVGKADHFTS